MIGYSNGTIPFNHGQLCQMLRSASDKELANVINDVRKIQEQRKDTRKQTHAAAIKSVIDAAIKDGYAVRFIESDEETLFTIHANNYLYTNIDLEEDY